MNQTIAPFARPLYVMTKPVGAVCNLACDYCYYLEKANLYKDISKHVMSDELLEKFKKPSKKNTKNPSTTSGSSNIR